MLKDERKFLIRLGSAHFKREQKNMISDDCIVKIVFDKGRIAAAGKENPEAASKMANIGSVCLRFVRIFLPNGDSKVVATNLSSDTFSCEDIGHLYRMRWGIETVYDDLKNKFEIENFTGTKRDIIMQDIYATILLSNITNDMILDASPRIIQKYKHTMQINRAYAIGVLKAGLLFVFLEKSHRKRIQMIEDIYVEILTELLPVRPDRKAIRHSGFASKFSNVRKRTY